MNLEPFHALWRGILERTGLSERAVARKAGMETWDVRNVVLPRRSTAVEEEVMTRVRRIANALPEEERSGLLRLAAASRAGELGLVITELKERLDHLENLLDQRDHTPMTERLVRKPDRLSNLPTHPDGPSSADEPSI